MGTTNDWSTQWSRSTDPSKQRKFRRNAPKHRRKQFMNVHLADDVQDRLETRSVPVRTGDKVRIVRGDFAGEEGRVEEVDMEETTVYVDGVEREAVDGSDTQIAIRPSNLLITKLDLDDDVRLAKYEVSEEEREEISVEPEEDEEDSEEAAEETADEDDAVEAADATEEPAVDYDAIVDGTIDEVKTAVEEQDLEPEKVLEAEAANKDRVTLVEWLESRTEGESDE